MIPVPAPQDDPHLSRIEASNALEPGQYWRVKKKGSARAEGPFDSDVSLHVGDMHLLVKLFDFDGVLHSVTFLGHPRDTRGASFPKYTMLVHDFLNAFDPVPLDEAKAVRAQEQAGIMAKVQAMQQEMVDAQLNPLLIPGVQDAAEKAVSRFEREEATRVQRDESARTKRDADLRRIHRRAARRSEANGNPLAIRKATISDRLDVMISEGITADGVRDLQLEAGRRLAMAEASANWLKDRSTAMGDVLKELTPYAAESGQLALATASIAIDRVKQISAGIASLNLYTGAGVEVYTVWDGADAPTTVPLTIVQGKIAMDEELAVHVDVEDSFDFTNKQEFFKRLTSNPELLRQVFPTERCVVSVQVTRRKIEYGDDINAYDRAMRDMANQLVFLLVRNGENIHAVYSCEPSHEAATRLFPTRTDLTRPFQGVSGVIGLNDVAFSKAAGKFDDQALHYKRFLILLCGLDHRLNLFGDFAPVEARASFISEEFQRRFLSFLENDDPGLLLGGRDEPVSAWMERHNAMLRSGSRVVVDSGYSLVQAIPFARKSHGSVRVDKEVLDGRALIAADKAGGLFLAVPTNTDNGPKLGRAWLTGPERCYNGAGFLDWFLCIDRVKLDELRAYIYDRTSRCGSIAWLRTLRRVELTLMADEAAEAELRAYVRQAALDAGIQTPETIDGVLDDAIATWRADHRGAPAPQLSDKKGMSELLSLVFPADNLAVSMGPLIGELCAKHGLQPLMATRTGKNKLLLYTVVPEAERMPYGSGVVWGWVKRCTLVVGARSARISSQAMAWLSASSLEATEEIFLRWPELDNWTHQASEPIKLSTLQKIKEEVEAGNEMLKELAKGRDEGAGLRPDLFKGWLDRIKVSAQGLTYVQSFYLSVPIAVYQSKAHVAPSIACARMHFVDLVRTYGTPEQLAVLANAPGLRSAEQRKYAASKHVVRWDARVMKALPPMWLQRGGELGESLRPSWLFLQDSHFRGGVSRADRSRQGTRAERRAEGGAPFHRETTATLSWNRAIDALMGIKPLHARAFNRSVAKRVKDVWCSFSSSEEEVLAKRKAERERRFEAEAPAAIFIADCLMAPSHGRSVANRYLSGARPKATTGSTG